MPDAVATPKEGSRKVDSQGRSEEAASQGRSEEADSMDPMHDVDSQERVQEADSQGEPREVEVACPHCDRPTSVRVSNDEAEIHVRPSIAGFGEHTATRCSDGHEFWIYYC